MRSELLFANILTKPLQGQQFIDERKGLTGWYIKKNIYKYNDDNWE
jgi:hypothetical protein